MQIKAFHLHGKEIPLSRLVNAMEFTASLMAIFVSLRMTLNMAETSFLIYALSTDDI